MRTICACLIGMVAVALAACSGIGATTTATAAQASTVTVVYGFSGQCPPTNWTHPAVRPTHAYFNLACEDGIRHIKWHAWGHTSATGHGQHLMFNGLGFTPQNATITLSRVRTHTSHRYFSHLVMRWTTRNGRHHEEVLNWRHDPGVGWIWG